MYHARSPRMPGTQFVPLANCRHQRGSPLTMDVFGAGWEDKIVYSCFFPFSIRLSIDELWKWYQVQEGKMEFNLWRITVFWNELRAGF